MLLKYDKIKTAVSAYKLDTQKPVEVEGCRGLWICGPPGTGKTHKAREISKGLYEEEPFIFSGEKWFDGYKGEKVIVIEDLDRYTVHKLGHNLKLWSDRYGVSAEVKGATIPLMHEMLVVTSNYTIEEAFAADTEKATSM